ncbi:MAG: hypothetical protein KC543_07765, partial [Myxococcales bacterium]|nr:hypothetical protein [Myxococcales bacterium]
ETLRAALQADRDRERALRASLGEAQGRASKAALGFTLVAGPTTPTGPLADVTPWLWLFGGPLAGAALVCLIACMRELVGLRVRTARELAWWGRGPVVGSTTWPSDAGALDALVEELEDHGVWALGSTLVVPATERERAVSAQLARCLHAAPWLGRAVTRPAALPAPTGERLLAAGAPGLAHEAGGAAIERVPTEGARGARAADALALSDAGADAEGIERPSACDWDGPLHGPILRRSTRLSDRVLVVAQSGARGRDVARARARLGRPDGVGWVLVGASERFVETDDRVGDVATFWAPDHVSLADAEARPGWAVVPRR